MAKQQQWIIKQHKVWYKKFSVILSFIICSLAIVGSYVYLNFTLHNTKYKLVKLESDYDVLNTKYLDLKTTKIKLERQLEIALQSHTEIKTNLLNLHQNTQSLTEQVDLYKRIMSVTNSSKEILVENFAITKINSQEDNIYNLSLVLLQASKKRDYKSGRINISISGKLGDNVKTLSYSQIAVDKNSKLNYKFRDYQHINQAIKLPDDFIAQEVNIEVLDNNKRNIKSQSFAWEYPNGGVINVAQK